MSRICKADPAHPSTSHPAFAIRAMIECYIGLGSNRGDRKAMVRQALDRLAATPGIFAVVASSLRCFAPWGFTEQPPFVNAVARLRTELGPVQLLLALKKIERDLGRTPTFRWGPREIDLDLLLYGDCHVRRRGLTVPHPHMHERAFVLDPLRELWPGYRGEARGVADEAAAEVTEVPRA